MNSVEEVEPCKTFPSQVPHIHSNTQLPDSYKPETQTHPHSVRNYPPNELDYTCQTPPFRNRFSECANYRAKKDIPVCDGQMNISEFSNRVKAIENFFDYIKIPKDKQVKMVAYKLKGGGGNAWWDRIQATNR